MDKPSNTLLRLAAQLFSDPGERERFLEALHAPLAYAPALVWLRSRPVPPPFPILPPWSWQPDYVDRVSVDYRPGQHPLHAEGYYYCLDSSSVFASLVWDGMEIIPKVIIDLCAAPGGKSVLAWRCFHPRYLICNEVIGKRTAPLVANLKRCGIHPAIVTTRDSSRWAESYPAVADLVVVDAPCSGQSLVARGKPSPGGFHPATINMNTNRQRRILAHAAALVAPGGYLAYMTCTYATKENEGNVGWFTRRFPHFVPCRVPTLENFQSHCTTLPCYRLWPQSEMGAGGFAALLRNTTAGEPTDLEPSVLASVWTSEGTPPQNVS